LNESYENESSGIEFQPGAPQSSPVQVANGEFVRFFEVLADPAWFGPWAGQVVRQSTPRWMSRPYRLTGAGALLTGARWNLKRLMPAIYASTDPVTLNAELFYKGARYGWTEADFNPLLMVGMHWKLQSMVDLTSPALLNAFRVTRRSLEICHWENAQLAGVEPVTQAIARAAFERMAEGLIVPSARRKGGINIVFFPSHRRDGSVIQPLREDEVPFMHGL